MVFLNLKQFGGRLLAKHLRNICVLVIKRKTTFCKCENKYLILQTLYGVELIKGL